MKVHVSYTVTVDDFYRRAIRHHYGQEGLATRDEVKRWFEANGAAQDDDVTHDLQMAIERGEVAEP